MINKRMAEIFSREAEALLEEGNEAMVRGRYHRAIRLSQESFELAMKSCLRSVGIEYPKVHDVGDVLEENRQRFPSWMQSMLPTLEEANTWLVEKRGPAMYGDEVGGVPAAELFTRDDAKRAVQHAQKACQVSSRLIRELFGN